MGDPISTIESGAGGAFSIIKGVWDYLQPGDISLKTDHINSKKYPTCEDKCDTRDGDELVLDLVVSCLGVTRARCTVHLAYEWNGCDVTNVRVYLGNDTYVGFLSGAAFKVEATAGGSTQKGPSACECCKSSACVVFDISVTSDAALTFGTGRITRRYRICGDGKVTPLATP
jgi:hypothetical protein